MEQAETAFSEQLLRNAQKGDEDAFAALAKAYGNLIRSKVASFGAGRSEADKEDLAQEATIALCRAVQHYDIDQDKVTFGLYAQICIENALSSYLNILRRHDAVVSVDMAGEGEPLQTVPEDGVTEAEDVARLLGRIRCFLSPFEYRVWSMYVAGYRNREIARTLEKDPHSIENAVYRIRNKLRKALRG